jgi:glycosyltransferase involved in cell wall biosynthesis
VAKVSVLIPSRNERFLVPTVKDLLSKARGDVEVLVALDGYWELGLPADTRLKILHHGQAKGMRPSINALVQMATGDYFLKCDGHTMWDEGWDVKLQADYHEDNWILTCRRYALEPEAWAFDTSNPKYPIDYHYLSNPYERPDDEECGLHGTPWNARKRARRDVLLDEEMSSQGSAWFMSRKHWDRLGPMEIARYGNFYMEMQELGLKTWLGGGAMMVTKRTHYAHLWKGAKYGRGYALGANSHRPGREFGIDFWMQDKWPGAVRTMRWLVERFSPVPSWPADLDTVFRKVAA